MPQLRSNPMRACERVLGGVGQPGDLFTDPHLLATGGLLDVFVSSIGGNRARKSGCPPCQSNSDRTAIGPGSGANLPSRRALAGGADRGRFLPRRIDNLFEAGVIGRPV